MNLPHVPGCVEMASGSKGYAEYGILGLPPSFLLLATLIARAACFCKMLVKNRFQPARPAPNKLHNVTIDLGPFFKVKKTHIFGANLSPTASVILRPHFLHL